MSFKYIQDYYKVPAKRGAKVLFLKPDGSKVEGTIRSTQGHYLKIDFGSAYPEAMGATFHPTWNLEYL